MKLTRLVLALFLATGAYAQNEKSDDVTKRTIERRAVKSSSDTDIAALNSTRWAAALAPQQGPAENASHTDQSDRQ
jgi:hypothetical protein